MFLQVADQIAVQILNGQWVFGAKIPGVRQLAMEMKVATNTVQRSFMELRSRGIIQKTGIGHFVTADARTLVVCWWKKRLLEEELPEFFKTMYLLNIGWEEIENGFERFKADLRPTIK